MKPYGSQSSPVIYCLPPSERRLDKWKIVAIRRRYMPSRLLSTAFRLPLSSATCFLPPDFLLPHVLVEVSVPCNILYTTVTVRCGHCTNLLYVNMRALLLPVSTANAAAATAANQLHLGHNFFSPQNMIMEEMRNTASNFFMNQPNPNEPFAPVQVDELPKPPAANRPPEKRQRVPSAYNRFIKEEIQRIKAGNPDISHREAFSAAAKNVR
ncbi:hypothetical protein E3N88_37100 [Mikania micrantha]|uniref:HMG box domain-containing protein n=1 Tax=Mikania micrantha TaxID=192012 RepID=A0A5N6M5H0_9ASTR|nr:hypothetical protein E3N88_37100 [Mikania micrantha]